MNVSFPRTYAEFEFRDGKRQVPDYLGVLLAGIETHTMTYADAIAAANRKLEADQINAQYDEIVAAHFREHR